MRIIKPYSFFFSYNQTHLSIRPRQPNSMSLRCNIRKKHSPANFGTPPNASYNILDFDEGWIIDSI